MYLFCGKLFYIALFILQFNSSESGFDIVCGQGNMYMTPNSIVFNFIYPYCGKLHCYINKMHLKSDKFNLYIHLSKVYATFERSNLIG